MTYYNFDEVTNKGRFLMVEKRGMLKIVFAGLDNSGKTSILYVLEDKFSMLNPAATVGIEREEFHVLAFDIICWDLGGQDKFRTTHLKHDRTFEETDLFFFILDLQDRSRFGEAGDYYEAILNMFRKIDQKPPIILCFHKIDPDLKDNERILSNIQVAKQVFRRKSHGFNLQQFQTTIFEKWSLTLAFSKGLLKLSPKSQILDKQLQSFAKDVGSEAVLLLDENALLFGQYYKNQEYLDLCQIVSPHLATMADRIIKYGTNFEIFQVKAGGWIFFRDLEIEDKRFYLVVHNEQEERVKTIDRSLPDFAATISNVIAQFFLI